MVCVDLEGVLFPEIWVAASRQFGIEELSLTTRDVPDYDRLMAGRLALMKKHGIRVRDIVEITANMEPLEGALDFLDHLRGKYPTVIATDSFEQFLGPVKEKLRAPVLFCNALDLD